MSQQGGSSMISSSIANAEVKYQKALKQISKLINTNKVLKAQCEEREHILSTELGDMAMRCQEMERKYEESENEKHRMQEFMEELQDTNQDLRKEYQTLEREVGYLNDVLSQQNAELKKLSVFKDEKGISQLIKSYQQRQDNHKEQINRLQEHISQLKTTIDRIEEDLLQQTEMRQRYEDQYNIIGLEINKYRELNNYLMDKNQHILSDERNKGDRAGHHEVESVVTELKRQLEMLRNVQYQKEDVSEKQYRKDYQLLLEEKNSIALQLARTKDQLSISEDRIKELYEVEEKMSTALARSDILLEQNNMLKNRITILESKEIIDGVGFEQDSELRVFEDKINFMMGKNEPINSLKNSDDNTNFLQMKGFITDLQAKLQSVIEQKQATDKKYKNLKMKFSKKAQQNIILEESNKLLKGKLEGYERLAEKLNYELEKSMQAHEDEIVKMVAITNNLVSKKVEESKTASAFIKSQFDSQLQKAQRIQKTISQELDTLKLQNSTLKIKLSDVQDRQRQSNELLQIYQNRFNQVSARYKELEQENTSINQKVIKYEQLYQEEKARHQTILIQKQAVANKLNLVTEELNQRTHLLEESLHQKQLTYQSQIKRARQQLTHLKQQVQSLSTQHKRLSHELEHYRSRQHSSLTSIQEENSYIKDLEQRFHQQKQLNHVIETEVIELRHKVGAYDQVKSRLQEKEHEVMKVKDEANDLKRQNIMLRKELQILQLTSNDTKQHNTHLVNQITLLKNKLNNPTSTSSSSSQLTTSLQSKKTIQRLHQQIAVLQSSIRDQKRVSARHLNQLQHYKEQIQRLQEIISRNKQREQALLQNLSQSNSQLLKVQDELFEFRTKFTQVAHQSAVLKEELQRVNEQVKEIAQQLASSKAKSTKVQTHYQQLLRDLSSTKRYLTETDKMLKRLNSLQTLQWEQQRQKDNLASLVDSLNRILKNTESLQLSNTSSNQEYSFVPASSFGNLQSNYFLQASDNHSRAQVGGNSFGNDENSKNPITNDTFGVYSGSFNSDSTANVNFSAESFGRPAYSPYRTSEQV